MNVIELQGCSPNPLAHYLKAIGILRLVYEQEDSSVRGFWRNERFHLVTSLTTDELETFFLDKYCPTPFMSPWNKGAGFFTADAGIAAIESSPAPRFESFRKGIKEAREQLEEISQADAIIRAIKAATKTDRSFQSQEQRELLRSSRRYKSYLSEQLRVIESPETSKELAEKTQSQVAVLEGLVATSVKQPNRKQAENLKKQDAYDQLVKLANADFKKLKDEQLLPACRRVWRGSHAEWMRAAVVIGADGEAQWPALFGAAGGNDGRLDFTNISMRLLGHIFDLTCSSGSAKNGAGAALQTALFALSSASMADEAIGQFSPGTAGGANAGCGFGGKALVNPWDFLLMLEGAIAFSAGVSRRATTEQLPKAAAPFAVYESAAGFASGVDGEKSRGEQWMPLWQQPLTYRELTSLLSEARCQLGNKPAKRPVEMARAIARLGVARGISSFERYGFIERNGQSNLATPLGRWTVPSSPPPHQELLDQIEGWVDRLRIKAGGKGAPASIGRAARRCENAMMDCCLPATDAAKWRELLIRLGEAESQLVRSPGFTGSAGLQPLGAYNNLLSVQWLDAVGTHSAELRLALALAGAHGTKRVQGRKHFKPSIVWNPADPVRRHFVPLDTNGSWAPSKFNVAGERLVSDSSVVCVTNDLQRDAVRLLRRRLVIASQNSDEYFPLTGVPGTEASLTDILMLISGQVNEAEVLALARPLMSLDWSSVAAQSEAIRERLGTPSLREDRQSAGSLGVYGLFRLCHHWRSIETPIATSSKNPADWSYVEHSVRLSPTIMAHLAQGNLATAAKLAVKRLRVSGLMPHVSRAVGDRRFTQRLAMSLAFPISQANIRSLALRIVRPEIKHEPDESVDYVTQTL